MLTRQNMGQFDISDEMIEDCLPEVALAMAGMVVVRAEHLFAMGMIHYHAICEDFDELEEGEAIPTYTAVIEKVTVGEGYRNIIKGWERVR